MKKYVIVSIFVFLSFFGFSQQIFTGHGFLDTNQHIVRINSGSNFFWNDTAESETYIPKNTTNSTLFCEEIWVAAMDANDSLHFAGQRYKAHGMDFYPGPVASNYDSLFYVKYDKVWKVNKSTIDNHIQNYTNAGYTVPTEIADWPAHGDPSNGEATYLAPFVDVNNNYYYDPANGDYPNIQGDQAVYTIFNDSADVHGETGGKIIGIEIHAMAYSFAGNSNCLDSTFFISYKIYNRSNKDYHDVQLAIFTDFDLGDPWDDYIGCDTLRDSYFAYNGNNNDTAYGASPPAQAVVSLNEQFTNFGYYNNGSGAMHDPETAIEYYNYMNSIWKDGLHFTEGGIGYGGTSNTNYVFPGNPADTSQWSEHSEGNIPGDRRGFATFNQGNIPANSDFCFDLAFVYGRTQQTEAWKSVGVLKNNIDFVKNYYTTNNLSCGIWNTYFPEIIDNSSELLVYPNPAKDNIVIQLKDKNKYKIEIFNTEGRIIYQSLMKSYSEIIDIEDLSAGLYIIKLTDGTNKISKKIIVK